MYNKLLIFAAFLLYCSLSWAQSGTINVDYNIPSNVDFDEELEVEMGVTNTGTADIATKIIFSFSIGIDYPSSFPPPVTFSDTLDLTGDPLQPGEMQDYDLSLEVDDPTLNFTAGQRNIVTIWPRIAGGDEPTLSDYHVDSVEVNDPSATLFIAPFSKSKEITLFPSPSTGQINLIVPATDEKGLYLEVFNALGQKMDTELDLNSGKLISLGLQKYPAGLYVVNIRNANQELVFWGRVSLLKSVD